ncbi:sugar diacid recognition domain-containing protein [Pseudomonas peli]|uniref:sugar diacid recognition domain-containing protein n=1 Tax=Pseudomonas peli TaxID=592361 RepID=UPI003D156D2F
MAILPCNVNVMDSQGLDPGQRRTGAHQHPPRGRATGAGQWPGRRTGTDAAKCLKGVQPGVNLPLMLDGRLIGVLGLTGEPAAGAHLWRAGTHDRRDAGGPAPSAGRPAMATAAL